MPSQVTNQETRDRYYIESLIEETITSSQLEGASTTRRVVRDTGSYIRQPVRICWNFRNKDFSNKQKIGRKWVFDAPEDLEERLGGRIARQLTSINSL